MLLRKKIFWISRIVAVFFMGMIVAFFLALMNIDLENLRDDVLFVLQDSTGLPIQVDGEMSWKFSLRPQVELNDVRIPNEKWAKNKYGVDAKNIVVTLDLFSLLEEIPAIQNIRVQDVNVNLEKNAKGDYSLQKLPDDGKKIQPEKNTDEKKDIDQYPISIPPLAMLDIKNLKVNINGEKFDIVGFQFKYLQKESEREFSGWVNVNDSMYPFVMSFFEYNLDKQIYPMKLAVSIDGKTLIAHFNLTSEKKFITDFSVNGNVSDFSGIGYLLKKDLSNFSNVDFDINGHIQPKKIIFDKSSIVMGKNDIEFSGEYDGSKSIPRLNLNIKSKRFSVIDVAPDLYSGWKRPNRDLNVFHDIYLFGKEIRGRNLNINVSFNNLFVYRDINVRNLNARINFNNGIGRIDMKSVFAGGNINYESDITVDDKGRLYTKNAIVGDDIYIGNLMKEIRINDFMSGLPINIEAYLEADGVNMSEIMSTITGPIRVYSVGKGSAYKQLVENIYGEDFFVSLQHSLQDMFRDKKKYDQMKVSCVAVNTKVRNGYIETRNGVAVETEAVNLGLAGKIDLGRENIDLSLTTVPVSGLKLSLTGNVANTVEIVGNLAEPDIRINGVAVAGRALSATGIGLLLAPFTGGLGLVAGAGVGLVAGNLIENWLADSNPCDTAMEKGAPSMRHDPEWLNKPIYDLINTVMKN